MLSLFAYSFNMVIVRTVIIYRHYDIKYVIFWIFQMDALSTTRLKQQLDANHNELVSTKCSLGV